MISTGKGRLVIVGILLLLLVGLAMWYGTLEPVPRAGVYPGNNDLVENFDRYHGDLVTAAGRVQSVDPVVIETTIGPRDTLRLTIVNLQIAVQKGDELRVFGIAREGSTIESHTAFTVPPPGLWYAYGTSVLGGLWVLCRLVEHWQFDNRHWNLKRRSARHRIRTRIQRRLSQLKFGGD